MHDPIIGAYDDSRAHDVFTRARLSVGVKEELYENAPGRRALGASLSPLLPRARARSWSGSVSGTWMNGDDATPCSGFCIPAHQKYPLPPTTAQPPPPPARPPNQSFMILSVRFLPLPCSQHGA